MKKILMGFILILSVAVSKAEVLEPEKDIKGYEILLLTQNIINAYNQEAMLNIKVVEMLVGDGMNAEKITLILGDDFAQPAQIFQLPTPIREVKKVSFLSKNKILIEALQDNFDENDENIIVEKKIYVTFKQDAEGKIVGNIELDVE